MDQIIISRSIFKVGLVSVLLFASLFYSCGEQGKTPEYKSVPFEKMKTGASLANVKVEELVSETDTICGMNLKDGIADTIRIENKIYGFCSSGCKNKFQTITQRP